MDFGFVKNPELVNFELPPDHSITAKSLTKGEGFQQAYIGLSSWTKSYLIDFYPKGVDELTYYSQEYNCIEFNPSFYEIPSVAQIEKWRNKTPNGFKFLVKIPKKLYIKKKLMMTSLQ